MASDKYIVWFELENKVPESSGEKEGFKPKYSLKYVEISSLID